MGVFFLGSSPADDFLPELLATEDFDSFEAAVAGGVRSLAAACVRRSIEAFDAALRSQLPRGWSLHEVAERTLITLVGAVTHRRSVYCRAAFC